MIDYYFNTLIIFRNENEHCRYPYVDHRQGKFLGRSYFKVENIITKSEPDEKEFELMEYLAAVNKLKYTVRRKKDSLNHLRETYKLLDKVGKDNIIIINKKTAF